MIKAKKIIMDYPGESYWDEVKKMDKTHDVVLCAVSEYGSYGHRDLRVSYFNIEDDSKEEYIDKLKEGLKLIQAGKIEELSK